MGKEVDCWSIEKLTNPHTHHHHTIQIRAYGACIAAKLEAGAQGVERGVCEAEFAVLQTCFQAQLQALRKSGGGKR